MAGFDLVADKSCRMKFAPELCAGTRLMDIAESNGLFIRAVGETILLTSPLIISEAEISELAERLETSMQQAQAELRAE